MSWPEAIFYSILVLAFFGYLGFAVWSATRGDGTRIGGTSEKIEMPMWTYINYKPVDEKEGSDASSEIPDPSAGRL